MGDGLPLKRTSVGTSHFGHTPPVLELIQPVLCPYSGETSPADATLYYHILSLPCLHFLGEISAIHKGERTVDVLFKDGDRDANVPMHLVKRYMYGDSCDQTLQREELADMCGMNVARSSRRKGKTYLSENMGIKSLSFAAPSNDHVPLAYRLIITSSWSTERSGCVLAGVVEDTVSLLYWLACRAS